MNKLRNNKCFIPNSNVSYREVKRKALKLSDQKQMEGKQTRFIAIGPPQRLPRRRSYPSDFKAYCENIYPIHIIC